MNKLLKPTITIGIPAYNEEANLPRIIRELLSQTARTYVLREIIVVLDGCTDGSLNSILNLKTSKLRIINGHLRRGKPARLNQIFSLCTSSVLITVDADIYFTSLNTIAQLIKPFITGRKESAPVDYVSGNCEPFAPKNRIQKIATAGIKIWTYARNRQHNLMYFSEGQFRAFSRAYYRKLKFPDTSADDVFPYIFAQTHGYITSYCPTALVHYKLPLLFSDYLKQQFRYLQSPSIHTTYFSKKVTGKFFTITTLDRSLAFAEQFLRDPLNTTLYLCIWLLAKIKVLINKPYFTSRWEILASTK
jgi:glycosyltransferase involved in cell wall biosynthesis